MRFERGVLAKLKSLALAVVVSAAGLVAIVGSGGGGGLGLDFSLDCPESVCPPSLWVEVEPRRIATQLGQDVVFKANVRVYGLPNPGYSWCKSSFAGGICEPIAGATGNSLTVAHVNLEDDQATYQVRVTAGSRSMTSSGTLLVSTSAPINFSDEDFLPGTWISAGFEDWSRIPSTAFEVARYPEGGNPGAFLGVTYGPLATQTRMQVAHAAQMAVYDPAQLGAVYSIDFRAECKVLAGYGARMHLALMLRQAGRTYQGGSLFDQSCDSNAWSYEQGRGNLIVSDFEILDGSACGPGESCPDFSVSGAPITFGLITVNDAVDPSTSPAHGFDNWQVSVWRR